MNSDNKLVDFEMEGIDSIVQTLFCHNALHNQLVQVTSNSVRLVCSISGVLKKEWNAPAGYYVATANATQLLLATGSGGSGHLVYLEIGDGVLNERNNVKVDGEISCLDLNPIGEYPNRSDIAAVAMWTDTCVTKLDLNPIGENPNCSDVAAASKWSDRSVRIYSLPKLNLISLEKLEREIIPRSVLMCSFEGTCYLLCALGDGHLIHFVLNMATGVLKFKEEVSLGTQPVTLRTFSFNGAAHVIASSNRPTVIHSSNKKFLYRTFDIERVIHMCPFNVKGFPNCFAIAEEDRLTIATSDDQEKLHIRSIPLNEHATRISHQEQTGTFAICSRKYINGVESQRLIRLLDAHTFEFKSLYELDQYEYGCSILSCSFDGDTNAYYCVGTAYVMPGKNEEPNAGRILVLKAAEDSLKLITKEETDGAVYSLNAFNGKLLASVNQKIQLYKWVSNDRELQRVNSVDTAHALALFVQTRKNIVVVSDSMEYISLLTVKENDVMEEVTRGSIANWMSALEIVDDDIYLGARNNFNLFTVKKNNSEDATKEQKLLKVVGEYDLGEVVNRLRRGSLVKQCPDSKMPTFIFGTLNGAIGVVASLSHEQYILLEELQSKLSSIVKGVGELSHEEWRYNYRGVMSHGNFIDGDLIESILEINGWYIVKPLSKNAL